MRLKGKHGGKRDGTGRPKGEPTTTIRIPNSLLETMHKMIVKHKETVSKVYQKQCNCIVLGYTAAGVPIINRCDVCKADD